MPSILEKLQEWYAAQCDGDWEHGAGIRIDTLDNPGWTVTIDLEDTDLENAPFAEVRHNEIGQSYEEEQDWLLCRKIDLKFRGSGGPKKLEAILQIFVDWAESASQHSEST